MDWLCGLTGAGGGGPVQSHFQGRQTRRKALCGEYITYGTIGGRPYSWEGDGIGGEMGEGG